LVRARRRDTVFELHGDLRATIVWRRRRDDPTRLTHPRMSTRSRVRATFRQVRTYVDSGPLIVEPQPARPLVELPAPPARHEEIYLYRFGRPTGSAADALRDRRRRARRRRADGHIERITSVWHRRRRGADLYYLWALAGADTLEASSTSATPESLRFGVV
jgi:hypothetical protein